MVIRSFVRPTFTTFFLSIFFLLSNIYLFIYFCCSKTFFVFLLLTFFLHIKKCWRSRQVRSRIYSIKWLPKDIYTQHSERHLCVWNVSFFFIETREKYSLAGLETISLISLSSLFTHTHTLDLFFFILQIFKYNRIQKFNSLYIYWQYFRWLFAFCTHEKVSTKNRFRLNK